jgi:hypothetical protein
MKRSKSVWVSICSMSLLLTGCGGHPPGSGAAIVPPSELPAEMRAAIPNYIVGENPSGEKPPLNAYSENLGYYHQECSQWFPFPFDYYDTRWGYYRNGKWSRYNSTRSHYHTPGIGSRLIGGAIRTGAELVGATMARGPSVPGSGGSSTGTSGSFGSSVNSASATPPPMPAGATPPPMPGGSTHATPPPMPDYDVQPKGSPNHSGVAHANATSTRSSNISRGGFGSTGKSSASGSGFHSSSSGS